MVSVSTNDVDAQEVAILSMHLLQSCLVYVNTLMIQQMLAEPDWQQRMTEADWRGMTPLFCGHVNPYGAPGSAQRENSLLGNPVWSQQRG